jgi:hypothetical protein
VATAVGEYLTAERPPEAIIIDPKLDYTRMATALGGTVVALSEEPAHAINCMDLAPPPAAERIGRTHNAVREGITRTLGFVALACATEGEPLRATERALVMRCAERAYADRGIRVDLPRTWDVARADTPTLADLHRHLTAQAEPAAKELAVRLEPYALGVYAPFAARPTTLHTRSTGGGLVVFDIAGLKPELRPLATYMVTGYTWGEARRRPGRRLFVMDEISQLLLYPECATLVGDVYTMGRSFGLAAWSASQTVGDYTRDEYGRRVLSNAHTAFLMRQQDDTALARLRGTYHLSEEHAGYLERADVGQGVLCTVAGNVALRITPPPIVLEWLPQAEAAPAG